MVYYRQIFVLSMVVISANFYLRFYSRFMATLNLKLLTFAHPVVLSMPLIFCSTFIFCEYIPICELDFALNKYGLKYYCTKAIIMNPGWFSDYYIALIWMVIHICWSYLFVEGNSFHPLDEL